MAQRPLTFRARDLVQALLSIKKAGLPIASVEIEDG